MCVVHKMEGLRICLFLCLLGCVLGSDLICQTGYCRSFTSCTPAAEECSINNATHSGIWLPSPTTCNCCEYCLPFYGDGEDCSTGGPGTGFTVGRCGDGLTCVNDENGGHSYCDRMESACHTAQDVFDQRQVNGEIGAMETRPLCDAKGRYASFDCVPAHTCFCQSEEGERLFGEVLNLGVATTRNMHCGCSRLHAKISQLITPGVGLPVIGPRCTSDGNFNPIQCLDNSCYCVDTITGVILEGKKVNLDEHPITDLSCYDAALDLFPHQSRGIPPYNYTTPCFEAMKEKEQLVKQSEVDGYIVDYFNTFTECMPDGTYGRVEKKRTGEKICVDDRGLHIDNYEAQQNTAEYDTMDCKCAQTSLIMATSTEKPICCKNGNFRSIQCRRGMCRCVDSDGRQTERESADVTTLSCYTPDWRTC